MVGDRRDLIRYTGNLVGVPTFLPPTGYGAILDTSSTPGTISFEITSLPGDFEWIAATGDFFNGGSWDLGSAPTSGGLARIRNGGTATADGSVMGAPAEILLREFIVGDQTGAGAAQFVNQDLYAEHFN